MKKILCFLLIALFAFSCLVLTASAEFADFSRNTAVIPLRAGGGGGSSGSGGGGSSGGSGAHSGASSDYGTGYTPTLFESILQFIMFPFVLFSSSILFYITLTKRSRKAKKLMKQMRQSDSAWKYENISTTVNDSYYAIQAAWSDMDMTPAKKYMSDDLFNSFQIKLKWMAYRKEKNVLEKIRLLQALPVAVHDDSDNSRDYVWFYIKGRMIDYTIDTDTHMKISGSTAASSFVEYWQFVRKENDWVLNIILQKNEAEQIPFND